jgi:BirA family biotin operon repressor/biotin-[acetyl-CoA-carboxylase] ligase
VFEDERLVFAILGLGMNVSSSPPPESVDFPATCVQAEAGREIDRVRLLRAILARLEARYPALQDDSLHSDWRARLAMMNEPILVSTLDGDQRGRAVDADPDGALLFQLESGRVMRILAGDVRALRPPD